METIQTRIGDARARIESRGVFSHAGIWIDKYAERVHLHQQNPATATLAAFSSAMGRYSASRHPPPRSPSPHPASRASSVFCPYRCFRSTPSILPLTYPSSPTIVPFSHPFCLLPLRRFHFLFLLLRPSLPSRRRYHRRLFYPRWPRP